MALLAARSAPSEIHGGEDLERWKKHHHLGQRPHHRQSHILRPKWEESLAGAIRGAEEAIEYALDVTWAGGSGDLSSHHDRLRTAAAAPAGGAPRAAPREALDAANRHYHGDGKGGGGGGHGRGGNEWIVLAASASDDEEDDRRDGIVPADSSAAQSDPVAVPGRIGLRRRRPPSPPTPAADSQSPRVGRTQRRDRSASEGAAGGGGVAAAASRLTGAPMDIPCRSARRTPAGVESGCEVGPRRPGLILSARRCLANVCLPRALDLWFSPSHSFSQHGQGRSNTPMPRQPSHSYSISADDLHLLLATTNCAIIYAAFVRNFWAALLIVNVTWMWIVLVRSSGRDRQGSVDWNGASSYDEAGSGYAGAMGTYAGGAEALGGVPTAAARSLQPASGVADLSSIRPPPPPPIPNGLSSPVAHLRRRQPLATDQECARFLRHFGGDVESASDALGSYLRWRADSFFDDDESDGDSKSDGGDRQETKDEDEDEGVWRRACAIAVRASAEVDTVPQLPRMVYLCGPDQTIGEGHHCPDLRAADGTRVVHVLPALLDPSLAPMEIYVSTIAAYLDLRLCRSSPERVTIAIDVRGGRGWPNPTPLSVFPFIRLCSSVLGGNFPDRLEKCVLFPLPGAALYLWKMGRTFLDESTGRAMEVVAGGGDVDSPVPRDGLRECGLGEECVSEMERRRVAMFVTEG